MPAATPRAAAPQGATDFWTYWTGQPISAFGSAFTTVVLPLLVLHPTHSSLSLAAALVFTFTPLARADRFLADASPHSSIPPRALSVFPVSSVVPPRPLRVLSASSAASAVNSSSLRPSVKPPVGDPASVSSL